MSLSLRMARHSLIYGANILATQALGFLLIPIYTRAMPPGDYGALEILNRTSEILGIFVLAGLRLAVVRFVQDPAFMARRSQIVGSAMWIVLGLGLIFLAGLTVLADVVAAQILHNPPLGWAVRLMAAGSFCDVLCVLPMALLQADQKSIVFARYNFIKFGVGLTLNLTLVAAFHMGLKGILFSALGSAGTMALLLQPQMWWKERPALDGSIAKKLLHFGLPFVPGGIFLFVLNNGDRYFLARLATPAEVGLYALGYKLGLMVLYLFVEPVSMNWSAMMVEIHSRPDGPALFSRTFTFIMAGYLCAGVGLSLLAPLLLPLIAARSYLAAAGLIPWICLGYFFWAASLFFDTPFYLMRRTAVKPFLLATATVLNLTLYAILIPRYRMYGAAWATVISFAFFAGLTWWFARREIDIPYTWGRLFALLAGAVGVVLLGGLAPSGPVGVVVRLALAAASPFLAWRVGLTESDRNTVKGALGGVLQRGTGAAGGS